MQISGIPKEKINKYKILFSKIFQRIFTLAVWSFPLNTYKQFDFNTKCKVI